MAKEFVCLNGDALIIAEKIDGQLTGKVIDVEQYIKDTWGTITLGELISRTLSFAKEIDKPRIERKKIIVLEIFGRIEGKRLVPKGFGTDFHKRYYERINNDTLLGQPVPFVCIPSNLKRMGFTEQTTIEEMFNPNENGYSRFRSSFREVYEYSRELLEALFTLFKDEILYYCLIADPFRRRRGKLELEENLRLLN